MTAEQIPGEKNQIPCDGPIDAQFVYSRDGINWQHADRARTAASLAAPAAPSTEA